MRIAGLGRSRPGTAGRWLPRAAVVLLLAACGGGAGPGGDRPAGAGSSEGSPAATPPSPPPGSAPSATAAVFTDEAAASGLDFVHFNGMSGELYLAEITCAGGALLDADGDGDLDAYLVQGHMLGGKGVEEATIPPRYPLPISDRLYRNDPEILPDGSRRPRFTDVTETSGLAGVATGYGCGVATGDVDNDGDVDLYLLNLGPNQLLTNRGDGTFRDATAAAGAGVDDPRSSVAAVFFDYDRDGWLDLFVGNNVTFDYGETICYSLTGAEDYCGPGAFPFEHDRLLHNDGDGTFTDVTVAAGLATTPARPTLGAVAGDFDGDGWLDLYVANDGEPNHLWINQGDGTFAERGLLSGCALNVSGAAEASMGVDAADVDADGDLDVFLAHLIKETNTLYLNDGSGNFNDGTAALGLAAPSLSYTSFGSGFLDYDNDGWLDLLVVNGAVTLLPELVRQGDPFPIHQPNQLFRHQGLDAAGSPRWEEVTASAGEVFRLSEVSRAAAFGDVDNDGDPDVLVVNNAGPARLLINRVGSARPWLGVRAVVGRPPRDALGARVAVVRQGRASAWQRVATDGSFNAANDPRVLFGLGDGPPPEAVRVLWPDGTQEELPGVPVGAYTTLVQRR